MFKSKQRERKPRTILCCNSSNTSQQCTVDTYLLAAFVNQTILFGRLSEPIWHEQERRRKLLEVGALKSISAGTLNKLNLPQVSQTGSLVNAVL